MLSFLSVFLAKSTVAAAVISTTFQPTNSPSSTHPTAVPSCMHRCVCFHAAGLSSGGLAASAASGQALNQLLARVDPVSTQAVTVLTRLQSWSSANAAFVEAGAQLAKSPTTQNIAAHTEAMQAVRTAQSQLTTARTALQAVILEGLNSEQRSAICRMSEAENTGVPAAYGIVLTTQVQRIQTAQDLKAEARATRMGKAVPESVQSRLTAIRSSGAVIAASQRIAQRGAAVTSAVAPNP